MVAKAVQVATWLMLPLLAQAQAPPPPGWGRLSVYHVNPAVYPDAPIEMNTGDWGGDMYFNLNAAATPILCRNKSSPLYKLSALACRNTETTSSDLVITKLDLEVDTDFHKYQLCNICVNGSDPVPMPPAPAPLNEPAAVQCATSTGPTTLATANCTTAHCWKAEMAVNGKPVLLQGCDTSDLCSKLAAIEKPGQCFELNLGTDLKAVCSPAKQDFRTNVSESVHLHHRLLHPFGD